MTERHFTIQKEITPISNGPNQRGILTSYTVLESLPDGKRKMVYSYGSYHIRNISGQASRRYA